MSKAQDLIRLVETDFTGLEPEAKFRLIIEMVRRGVIKDKLTFQKALDQVGWSLSQFLDQFEDLWAKRKIGYKELKMIDPSIVSDRIILSRISQKSVCDRIAPKRWQELPICRDCVELTGRTP